MTLGQELEDWIDGDEKRLEFMIVEAPTKASTIRATIAGRYNPSPLLERGMRSVMQSHPKGKPLPSRHKEAVG